jgi:RNase adaptor protein for sRNA GlmZ degradation
MLHSILQERFKLNDIIDQAYTEINRAQMEYDNLAIQFNQQTQANANCQKMLNTLKMIFSSFSREKQ